MYKTIDTRFHYVKELGESNAENEQNPHCWRYRAILENYRHDDLGDYYTYGIQVSVPDCVKILHDVSVCEETVDRMVELFNRYQLSPVHLQDVVEDMLT